MLVELEIEDKQEVFTHRDDDGTFRSFPVTAMRKLAEKHGGTCDQIRRANLPITAEVVAHIRANMGIEQERLDRLKAPYLYEPVMVILWNETESTVIDGNHRIVKAFEMGARAIRAYAFTFPFWEGCLIELADPKNALTRRSGVIEHEQAWNVKARK